MDMRREKNHRKDMIEMKMQYKTVNVKLWNLETRIDTMSKEPAESSRIIQSKLDTLRRKSIAQEKTIQGKIERTNLNVRSRNRHRYH